MATNPNAPPMLPWLSNWLSAHPGGGQGQENMVPMGAGASPSFGAGTSSGGFGQQFGSPSTGIGAATQAPPAAPAAQGGIGPSLNVSGSYNLPASSYLPFPNAAQNQQLTNTQVSGNLANNDIRNLSKQYLPAANSGVSTDYRNSPGMMANLLGPRSQAASQNELAMVQNPYSFGNANFAANLGLQGAQGNEAFNLGQVGQNIYQGGQTAQLGNLSSLLGLFQNLFGGLTGAMGNLTGAATGDTGGGLDLSSLLGSLGGGGGGAMIPPASGQGSFGPGFTGGFTGGF